MAHSSIPEQHHPLTPDPFTQWTSLRDIVSLIATENKRSEQQIAAIFLTSNIATLRPVLHDENLIRDHKQEAIGDLIRCVLTPMDERKHDFDSDAIRVSDRDLILLTIPVVTEWLSTRYPRLLIPAPWLKWMREDFPALYKASLTISSYTSASPNRDTVNGIIGNQQTVTLNSAPAYLGIAKYKFNNDVRPYLKK